MNGSSQPIAPRPLVVDIVWSSGSVFGPTIGELLFTELTGDADGRDRSRAGIATYFRCLPGHSPLPDWDAWEPTERRVVVLVIDDALLDTMADFGSPVRDWVDRLLAIQPSPSWCVLPVAISPQALRHDVIAGHVNAIRAAALDDPERAPFIGRAVSLALYLMLVRDPKVHVFISYATQDGGDIATALKRHLDDSITLDPFLDRVDIAPGERFADVLDESAVRGPLVAIVTDAYASSVWCGQEVLAAKRSDQPVLVVDAIDSGHQRSFPYLGNGPVVRWLADRPTETFHEIEKIAVRASLRRAYLPLRVDHVKSITGRTMECTVFARAPELMTLVALAGTIAGTVIYPDPPIPSVELALISAAFPHLRVQSLTEALV